MKSLDTRFDARIRRTAVAALAVVFAAAAPPASADDGVPLTAPAAPTSPAPIPSPAAPALPQAQRFNLYFQSTNTQQYHGAFAAAYSGPQSIAAQADTAKTFDATVFAGLRIGSATEFYTNVELDQGFGLGQPPSAPGKAYQGTYGAAGYPSAESTKLGSDSSYSRVQRVFVRQTFNFGGGDRQGVDPDINQLGGSVTPKNLVLTAGKFAPFDVFDGNVYAHDPKNDFLNWSIVDLGAFDDPTDGWGYSVGATAELSSHNSTARAGLFQLSAHPGSLGIDSVPFNQYGSIVEFEQRTSFFGGRAGSFKGLAFADTGYMGTYADALALGAATNSAPTTAAVRNDKHVKLGGGLNFAQEIAPHVGVFARASAMNGTYETYDFTDMDRSLSGGVSVNGGLYRRPSDAIGAAFAFNGLSQPAQRYFAAGGTGLIIGDGGLTYGTERILETYYKLGLTRTFGLTFDYQFIQNPGYNTVRGPISIFGVRYHTQL